MARVLHCYRVITLRKDDQKWTAEKLKAHLEQLTFLGVEVQQQNPEGCNPAWHAVFEVRIHAEKDVAKVFHQTVQVHFRTEVL